MKNFLPINLNRLETIRLKSQELKKGFVKTEKVSWNGTIFSTELFLQVTHLLNAIVTEKRSLNISPLKGINKGIKDETADVLFNLMNLANFLKIDLENSIDQYKIKGYIHLFEEKSAMNLGVNLAIQVGELCDTLLRIDNYKHKIRTAEENRIYLKKTYSASLIAFFALTKRLKINLWEVFNEMYLDASKFLQNNKSKR